MAVTGSGRVRLGRLAKHRESSIERVLLPQARINAA